MCAMAAQYGELSFNRLHDSDAGRDPAVQKMRERIRFIGREDWKDMEHGRHAIITLTTIEGQSFLEEIWYRPMSRQELEEKFKSLVTPRWGGEKTGRVAEMLQGLESAASIRLLMEGLGG